MTRIALQSLSLLLLLSCTPTAPAPEAPSERTHPLASTVGEGEWNPTTNMQRARAGHTATVLPDGRVLVAGGVHFGATLTSAELYDPTRGTWTTTGPLIQAREGHTATLLPDGKVLVVGGRGQAAPLSSAELYDPKTRTWSSARALTTARYGHTAVLLHLKVLVIGGSQWDTALFSTELYDPTTGEWTSTGSLVEARHGHTATLLPGGKVLVVGGARGNAPSASAELYDSKNNTWAATATLRQARSRHTATWMPDGTVLVVGGLAGGDTHLASCEVYDPQTQSWSPTRPLLEVRARHSAVLLPGGKLLVMGGFLLTEQVYGPVSSTEIYSPATQTWAFAGWLRRGRFNLTATLLPEGDVLVAGGMAWEDEGIGTEVVADLYTRTNGLWSSAGALSVGRRAHTTTLMPDGRVLVTGGSDRYARSFDHVDIYHPPTNTWTAASALKHRRSEHTATLLRDGRVLVAGGFGVHSANSSVELYDPRTGTWSLTGELVHPRYGHTATLLSDGRVLVAGGYGEDGSQTSVEIYDPETSTWSVTGPLHAPRARHVSIRLPSAKILVLGGEEDLDIPLSSAEVYDPATEVWSEASPMKHARRLFTATLLTGGKILVAGGEDASREYMEATELYSPEIGSSLTGPLHSGRVLHTATALPGGKVIVVGGTSSLFDPLPAAEIYNPSTETWSLLDSQDQARETHTATLLPEGKLLIVGGMGPFGSSDYEISSAELYGVPENAELHAPLITDVMPASLEAGGTLTVTGEYLSAPCEASSGNTQASSNLYPLLSLTSLENGEWVPLHWQRISDTSATAEIPYLMTGAYSLNITRQGVTASRPVFVTNTNPVETVLDSSSPEPITQSTTATFRFSSPLTHSFVCDLDGQTSLCVDFQHYNSVLEGEHLFQVRARTASGDEDPTPASYRWVVDRTDPETTIDPHSAPKSSTQDRTARFQLRSSEEGSTFECSLDGAPFATCPEEKAYSDLPDGDHVFRAKATDKIGNLDPSAAEHRWLIAPRSHYDMSCGTTSPDSSLWLLGSLLTLLRRRRSSAT